MANVIFKDVHHRPRYSFYASIAAWALLVNPESCILHEASIKMKLFGSRLGPIWRVAKLVFSRKPFFKIELAGQWSSPMGRPLKVAFCKTHSSKSSLLVRGSGPCSEPRKLHFASGIHSCLGPVSGPYVRIWNPEISV